MKAAALALVFAISLSAQTPAFEVASVKQSASDEQRGQLGFMPGGRITVENCTLTFIIQEAYGLRDFQVAGGPKWISDWDTSRFDIQAKAAGPVSNDQLKLMLQTLLADRFQLKVHREMRSLPVFALVVDKGGSKLRIAKDDGKPRGGGGIQVSGPGSIRGTNVYLSNVVQVLSGRSGRFIVDKTNFTEPIDFSLQWSPDDTPGDTTGLSIFTAIQEQLGLKLEPQKEPIEVLVIDSVERPTPN